MFIEARKIHLIEEMLKIDNDQTLSQIEAIFMNKKVVKKNKKSLTDFFGIINTKEANAMKNAISESCDKINSNDWK